MSTYELMQKAKGTVSGLGWAEDLCLRFLCQEFDALRAEVAALKALKESRSDPDEDENRQFLECDACRAKPGSPLLCGDCIGRRSEWSKRKLTASSSTIGKAKGDDRLLKIAALFNGWANAGPGDGGPCNGWTAQEVLSQIGEVLGDPFACDPCEPNAEPAKEEEFRLGLPAEAMRLVCRGWKVASAGGSEGTVYFTADGKAWAWESAEEADSYRRPLDYPSHFGRLADHSFKPLSGTWAEVERMAAEKLGKDGRLIFPIELATMLRGSTEKWDPKTREWETVWSAYHTAYQTTEKA